jgi:hypothetical protein
MPHADKCRSSLIPFVGGSCNCDGYHTFDELYDHRITLFITVCRWFGVMAYEGCIRGTDCQAQAWRSKAHHDGSVWDGWFILGIGKKKGEQITYHLPLSRWDETEFAETLEKAPEWDGHTPDDVLKRLKQL